MSAVMPFSLPRGETPRTRLTAVWAANVVGALIATVAAGTLIPAPDGIVQGGLVGISLGVAVIGFVVAFVAADRMDSLDEVSA
ncbi:hypothetical protein [Halorubrum distributum]|uniref:Uncharacterized protein n=1 Tax=Halorubrum distributum JCM 13916 TaxID=1230455 RepID=M0PQY8_9EURY|nr:hypothetical protein [Halorubrum arcis]EMA71949.1 hypothetical protein C462_04205 [Halorubrum arcis JCM 13916]